MWRVKAAWLPRDVRWWEEPPPKRWMTSRILGVFYWFEMTVVSQALQKCWGGGCWYFNNVIVVLRDVWSFHQWWANDEVVGVNDPTSDIGWPLPNYCSKFLQVEPASWLIDQPGMGVSPQPNAQSFLLLRAVFYASPTWKSWYMNGVSKHSLSVVSTFHGVHSIIAYWCILLVYMLIILLSCRYRHTYVYVCLHRCHDM